MDGGSAYICIVANNGEAYSVYFQAGMKPFIISGGPYSAYACGNHRLSDYLSNTLLKVLIAM